jgi:hypothetical protein
MQFVKSTPESRAARDLQLGGKQPKQTDVGLYFPKTNAANPEKLCVTCKFDQPQHKCYGPCGGLVCGGIVKGCAKMFEVGADLPIHFCVECLAKIKWCSICFFDNFSFVAVNFFLQIVF